MKVNYWVAQSDDAPCYHIRAITKKECERLRQEQGEEHFQPPVKVTIEYTGAFDLVQQLLQEGGPGEIY